MMITDERGDDKGNNIDDSNVDGDDESPKKSDDFDSKVLTLTLTGINCHPFIIALKIKNCMPNGDGMGNYAFHQRLAEV